MVSPVDLRVFLEGGERPVAEKVKKYGKKPKVSASEKLRAMGA
jgi:hypothetical protein